MSIKTAYQKIKKAHQEYNFLSQKYRSEQYLKERDFHEKLANLCHEQWADWMSYLFSKCHSNPDGTMTIPAQSVERAKRQIATSYKQLTEGEKNSDRNEADKFLKLMKENGYAR